MANIWKGEGPLFNSMIVSKRMGAWFMLTIPRSLTLAFRKRKHQFRSPIAWSNHSFSKASTFLWIIQVYRAPAHPRSIPLVEVKNLHRSELPFMIFLPLNSLVRRKPNLDLQSIARGLRG